MSVYFILAGRYFKIGASESPQSRCAKLHQSSTRGTFPADVPFEAAGRTLYKVVDGWKDREHAIHLALDDFSVGLEWFLDEPQLREFVDALPVAHDRTLSLPKVERAGGWCEAEYLAVQAGRAAREMSRFHSRRSA